MKESASGNTPRLATRGTVVRILYSAVKGKKNRPSDDGLFFFGRGIGIRTPTYRVRVCCAAVTQFPFVLTHYILAHIIWFVKGFLNIFLRKFGVGKNKQKNLRKSFCLSFLWILAAK